MEAMTDNDYHTIMRDILKARMMAVVASLESARAAPVLTAALVDGLFAVMTDWISTRYTECAGAGSKGLNTVLSTAQRQELGLLLASYDISVSISKACDLIAGGGCAEDAITDLVQQYPMEKLLTELETIALQSSAA